MAGELIFEFYAWVISPATFGFALQPTNLVVAIIAKLTGSTLPHAWGFALHFLVGSLGFGLFVYIIRTVLRLQVALTGLLAGLALWFFAQGVLAPFIGRSFMMDFGPYTQSSFVGHVGMTMVMAFALDFLIRRFQPPTA
ncbi:hypothetical protein [Maricaulis sp.]|uniref:hypothetical protein n=1 Tax=Maricaulis sp. TaxID=1486257 RepID=UPI003A91AEAC